MDDSFSLRNYEEVRVTFVIVENLVVNLY